MLTRQKIVDALAAKRSYLSSEFGVARIGLFGSYARGNPREGSDIDLLIEFKRPIGLKFIELVDFLESSLGHKVDVLTPTGLESIRVKRVANSIAENIVYV